MNNNINDTINKYNDIANTISIKYNYPSNISHLLGIVIYAFIIKYGIDKERLIINTFSNVPIFISNKTNQRILAFYQSIPVKEDNKIVTKKRIVINNYENISLINLLDNLIHEYNHAINSYNNEIIIEDNIVKLRCGLSYINYDFNLNPIEKDNNSILEEILNTNQTTDIINIIKNIDYNSISNIAIQNTLYSINGEINNKYLSNSYFLEVYICKTLLNNKTFISTLNSLRINGNINDIDKWFNDITGINNSYHLLTEYLNQVFELEHSINNKKIKWFTINKIKKLNNKIINIIKTFDNNLYYK